MKKLIAALLAMLLALSFSSIALAEEEEEDDLLAQIQAAGEIVVATEGMWSPWTYHDEDDNLTGYDVEVMRIIAEKLGVEATFVEVEWDGIFAGIDAERYDIAANGVEITEERAEKYDFSIPYGYIQTALIVRGDNEDITCFEDLDGKTTCNSISSTYMTLAESYGATAVGVDTLDQTIEMVLTGRADATLNAVVSYYDYMEEHPDANLKIVALTEEASEVALPVRKGDESASLLEAINAAIEEMYEDGTLSALSLEFFGVDISEPSTATEETEEVEETVADEEVEETEEPEETEE